MTRDLLVGVAMFLPAALWCQSAARPEFEVASVKPSPCLGHYQLGPQHGSFTCENAPLQRLIGDAYHLSPLLVSGPAWLDSVCVDIDAKGKGGAPDSEVRLMLQSLLADRFGLQTHKETKEMSVYFLEVATGGLKAKVFDPSAPVEPIRPVPGSPAMMSVNGTLPLFAMNLSRAVGRPVIDHTGIPGTFHLLVAYDTRENAEGPDLFAALREQLGLKLESGRGPVETLIVDHADKVPTEN
jgi:uncharacterized protein (TIGR03435 family)